MNSDMHQGAGAVYYSNPYMQAYQQSSPYGQNDNYGRGLGEDYMQQEEEWEREGLLDPLWEKQQRKVSYYCTLAIIIQIWTNFEIELKDFHRLVQLALAQGWHSDRGDQRRLSKWP